MIAVCIVINNLSIITDIVFFLLSVSKQTSFVQPASHDNEVSPSPQPTQNPEEQACLQPASNENEVSLQLQPTQNPEEHALEPGDSSDPQTPMKKDMSNGRAEMSVEECNVTNQVL